MNADDLISWMDGDDLIDWPNLKKRWGRDDETVWRLLKKAEIPVYRYIGTTLEEVHEVPKSELHYLLVPRVQVERFVRDLYRKWDYRRRIVAPAAADGFENPQPINFPPVNVMFPPADPVFSRPRPATPSVKDTAPLPGVAPPSKPQKAPDQEPNAVEEFDPTPISAELHALRKDVDGLKKLKTRKQSDKTKGHESRRRIVEYLEDQKAAFWNMKPADQFTKVRSSPRLIDLFEPNKATGKVAVQESVLRKTYLRNARKYGARNILGPSRETNPATEKSR